MIIQDVVRKLKKFFNEKFNELFEEKEETLEQMNQLNQRLRAILSELRYSVGRLCCFVTF